MIRFTLSHRKIFLVVLVFTIVASATVLVAQKVDPVGTGQGQVDMSLPVAFTGNFRSQLDAIPTRGALVTITQNDAVVFRGTTDGRGQIHTRLNEGPTKFTVQPTIESGFVGMETDVSITGPELAYWFQMTKNSRENATNTSDMPPYQPEKGYAEIRGYVIDMEDGNPLAGVLIKVKNSRTQTTSKADGSYALQIYPNDAGMYLKTYDAGAMIGSKYEGVDFIFSLDGYEDLTSSMGIGDMYINPYDGTREGSFVGNVISSSTLMKREKRDQPKQSKSNSLPPPSGGDFVSERASQNYTDCVQRAVVVLASSPLTNPATDVCGGGGINYVYTIQDYVQRCLPNEWYAYYHIESLKAGAVAIRSYVLYRMLYYPASTNNYHAKGGPCFQAFGSVPTQYASNITTAVNATTGQIMVRSDGNVAYTEYSSENNNYGTQCSWCGNTPSPGYGNGYVANCSGSYAPPTGPISDVVGTNRTRCGHGRGMCQVCSQSWASGIYAAPSCGTASNTGQSTGQGMKSYYFILAHYYPNFTLPTVPLPLCSYPCSNVYNLNCVSTQTISSQSTVGLSNYYNTYNNTGCVTWNMNGPEKIYKITPSSNGILTVSLLSPSNANLRIIILKASTCSAIDPYNSAQVLGYSSSSTGNATVNVTSGQTYFIIVDGKQLAGSSTGQSGTYNLKVVAPCSAPPGYNQQLVTTCTAISTGYSITANVTTGSEFVLTYPSGQMVASGKADDGIVSVNVNTFGIYFLSVTTPTGEKCVQKIFVRR